MDDYTNVENGTHGHWKGLLEFWAFVPLGPPSVLASTLGRVQKSLLGHE